MSTTINILGYKWTPQQRVRPWALAGPILILLFCLPLLRPLRYPDPRDISDHELARLATVQAIVEHQTLATNESQFHVPRSHLVMVGSTAYAAQPATMAMLLAGAYWAMTKLGLNFADHGPTVSYLLTLLGVTIPVAAASGLIYRMARLFELTRPWRTGLGLACVVGTGLISYATVLNPHAPAAVLVLCATACLIHVAGTKSPKITSPWLIVAGFCAMLAAAIDPPALIFTVLFVPVILVLRWPISLRLSGLVLYAIGILPPLALHASLTIPVTGDLLPPGLHRQLALPSLADAVPPAPYAYDEDIDDYTVSVWQSIAFRIGQALTALLGSHGLLSHFPILILGCVGVGKIMHRHWPNPTKVLAAASLIGAITIVLFYAVRKVEWSDAMFAARWFIVFTPLMLFWTGAWLRKNHRPTSWTLMAVGLAFSTIVSLIGATGAWPKDGFDRYTVVGAVKNLLSQDAANHDALARR